ncbi:PIN domain-containing protein [Kitasatospora sp. NPDC093102]|uniref:PIN domain-containing protein n=1 Tax=Kitasatospora sp. NPDC093102 TaxID=3155069 RepID=UPI0034191505
MIIFDTNVINRVNPRSPRADVVRALRASGKHKVGVTATVLEELAAHQAKDYMAQRQAAVTALNALRKQMPWQPAVAFEEPRLELEECLGHWRSVYSELFEVLPCSEDVALKALAREALALPPAKQGPKRGEGARDAAICFAILDYLHRFPDEEIHFVTDNSTDFGDGITYRFPMDEDLGPYAARLKRLTTFDDVVTAFTEPVDSDSAFAETERHLSSEAVTTEIGKLALAQRAVVGFPGVDSAGSSVEWKGWIAPPSVMLLRTGNVVGHRIEEQVWYTAEPTWLLFGTAGIGEGRLENVSCTWKIKLLFPIGDGENGVTLLSTDDPNAPDLQDGPTADAVEAFRAKIIKEMITSTRRPVGEASSAGAPGVHRALVPNLPVRLDNALDVSAVSQAAAAMASQRGLVDLAEAVRAGLEPLVASGLLDSMRTTMASPMLADALRTAAALVPQYDFSLPPFTQVLEAVSQIDIASTMPTYSLTPVISATASGWPHAASGDAVEEESNGEEAGSDDVQNGN